MEAEDVLDEISTEFNNGDWCSEPWFLSGKYEEFFNSTGYTREIRQRAATGLKRAFPPEVCREMLQRTNGGFVAPLFIGIPVYVLPLLKLGLALERLASELDDNLLSRLHQRNSYHPTQFEIVVWANLRRAGYRCAREPKGPGKKRPDFEVYLGEQRYILELKAFQRQEIDDLAAYVDFAFRRALPSMLTPGMMVSMLPSEEYKGKSLTVPGRREIREKLGEITQEFADRAKEVVASGVKPGRYDVSPYGFIEVVEADYRRGAEQCCFIPELSEWKQGTRLVDEVERKCKQLLDNVPGVLLFDVGRIDNLDKAVFQLKAKSLNGPRVFRNCRFVILHGTMFSPAMRRSLSVVRIPMQGHRLTDDEIKLSDVVTHDMIGDWLRTPERTLSSSYGKVELKPGQTVMLNVSNVDDINSDVSVEVKDNEPVDE